MGLETEYGVTQPGDPAANAMVMSGQVVNAYAQPPASRAGRRAGTTRTRARCGTRAGSSSTATYADPGQLTDDEDPAWPTSS